MAPPKTQGAKRGTIRGTAAHNVINFTIRVTPLPQPIFDFLRENLVILRRLQQDRNSREEVQDSSGSHQTDIGEAEAVGHDEEESDDVEEVDLHGEVLKRPTVRLEEFWSVFEEKCKEAGAEWADIPEQLWAFGPQRAGTCLLIDSRPGQPKS